MRQFRNEKISVEINPNLAKALRHYGVAHSMKLNRAIEWILTQHFQGSSYLRQAEEDNKAASSSSCQGAVSDSSDNIDATASKGE